MSAPYTEAWLAGPRKTSFYTRTYLPRSVPLRAAIVFVHGLGEHIGRYGHFHPRLAENGIAVFAYDQRGFGRTAQDDGHKSNGSSIGKTSWNNQMDDISWALHHVTSQYDSVPLFLMGHSMVSVTTRMLHLSDKYREVVRLWDLLPSPATVELILPSFHGPKE